MAEVLRFPIVDCKHSKMFVQINLRFIGVRLEMKRISKE